MTTLTQKIERVKRIMSIIFLMFILPLIFFGIGALLTVLIDKIKAIL